jgi:uncharacterized protein
MSEYLAPGVYIEEVSFRAKTIEGVSTSTAGFVGPTRTGPIRGEPEIITSFAEFERVYGGLEDLVFGEERRTNFVAHAARAFFEEGGRRLYVMRVYNGTGGAAEARSIRAADPPADDPLPLRARFPGRAGDLRITFTLRLSDNLLVAELIDGGPAVRPAVRSIQRHDTVVVVIPGDPATGTLHDVDQDAEGWLLVPTGGDPPRPVSALNPATQQVHLVTVDVTIERPSERPRRPQQRYELPQVYEGFALHPRHGRALTATFTDHPANRLQALTVPFALSPAATITSGAALATQLLTAEVLAGLADPRAEHSQRYTLTGGSDGALPELGTYAGEASEVNNVKTGLTAFEDLEEISIIAAPGYSFGYAGGGRQRINAIQNLLIAHCERMRYRVAVLDAPDQQSVGTVGTYRGAIDSTHAALYYPWVRIFDPLSEAELDLPPSGFVAGIYARNDVENGVHKAPANEVVRMAIGFETLLSQGQQEILNPAGVNCLRFFEGRGYRVWGARTISSDPEWKYLNVRRYFAYLQRSIERGTQWAVFENNSDPLWANVRRTVEDFLFNEWRNERLMGRKPEEAFFVRCDRTTMTQNDIDNGRMICLIGVAPVRPAEFVIFRIGQWTADRRA